LLSRIFTNPASEDRAISFQTIFATGDSLLLTTPSGVPMNQEQSLKLGAVYACVRLIADSVATLPVDTYVRRGGTRFAYRPRPEWLDTPEVGVTRTDHFTQVLVSLLLDGNAFIRILRDDQGTAGLAVMNPLKIKVERDPITKRPQYRYGDKTVIPYDEMIHIVEMRMPGELRGTSRIDMVKDELGIAAALDQFAARWFGQGSQVGGMIEFPGPLTREQAKDLVDSFEEQHRSVRRAHRPGVLFGGAKYVKTATEPNEAQMLESRQFAVEAIARVFRCPPQLLGVTTPGAQSYASVEQNGIHFVTYCLRPYIVKIEDAYARLLPNDVFMKFSVEGLLRGDQQSRFAAYSTGIQAGFLNINTIHRLEDMEPVEGGDVYRVPLANVNLEAANLTELDKKSSIAQRFINAGFDPASVLAALGLPDMTHTGLPTVQLQQIAQVDPEDPLAAYPVDGTT
jgi:HK97 family phage portal protein